MRYRRLGVALALDTIHQGDCIEKLQQLSAGSIDLAFADPPFNIGYHYDVYNDHRNDENYLAWTRRWMGEVCRVLKSDGTFWLAIGDEYAAETKLIGQNDLGLTCRSWIIWYYTFGVNCTKKFSRSHAHLFHFVKDPKRFTFNNKAIRVPSARQLVYADGRANPDGRLPDDTWILRPQDVPNGFSADQDTWYFPRVAGTFKERAGFHGCQMPEQLLGRIIRSCSNEGAVVLDPFAGSGTTLVVAKKLGRRWLGFELSESYAKKALARIDSAQPGQPLEGAPEPLVSAPRTPGRMCVARSKKKTIETASDYSKALIAAYKAVCRGFSVDRIIADPEMNWVFLDQCKKFGIPGDAVDWNRALMRLRKAGKLASLPATQRTTFSWQELDNYIFASEIAVRKMLDRESLSLDDILCDPEQAINFDELARSFSPGFSSLQYRWAALTLRKKAKNWRMFSRNLRPELCRRRLPVFCSIEKVDIKHFANGPGVYLIRDSEGHFLYVGETFDLGKRFQQKLDVLPQWQTIAPELQAGILKLNGGANKELCGLQSRLIDKYTPVLNYLELAS